MNKQNKTLHKLLDIMLSGDDVALSEKGKKELSEYIKSKDETEEYYNTKLEPVTWWIKSIGCEKITLCSNYHDIIEGISLDCVKV